MNDQPQPKRRLARTFAAAVAAAVVAGFSGYAVGHVTADEGTGTSQVSDDAGQQGFPGGEPPSGDFQGTPPSGAPDAGTGSGTDSGTDSGTSTG